MEVGIYTRRKEVREALLICFSNEEIADIVKSLYEISTNKKYKPIERIKASQTILDYTVGKIQNYKDGKNLVESFEDCD